MGLCKDLDEYAGRMSLLETIAKRANTISIKRYEDTR